MRVVISDSSVLIDLAKTKLIEATLSLPYAYVIPDVIFADELIDLKGYRKEQLLELGFKTGSLTGEQVGAVIECAVNYRRLAINDCFALILAEVTKNSILLTSDLALRKTAQKHKIETHGIIWLCEQMRDYNVVKVQKLQAALEILLNDPLCRGG